jgi:biopolymer transport protein ExbB
MIGAFDVIREFGTGDARGLASNISQALITTQFGLVAGVPGLVMGHFLRRRAEALAGLAERLHLVQACGEPRGEEAA